MPNTFYKTTWFIIMCSCLFSFQTSRYNDESPIKGTLSESYIKVKPDFKVVIDAGHGGKDPGTLGSIYQEKNIALQIALLTGKLIEKKHPDIEVIYTRQKDIFLPLFERIGIANQANADLFISIHCNATSKKTVKGTETFVMGLHKAEENLETAKRENSAILLETDFQENYEGFNPNSDAGHIILSMYQNTYLEQSIEFANLIENSMNIKTSRGVKQAGFVVLKRATMPSVLIETGFLSNKADEKKLGSKEGQIAIANSISKAFSKYLTIHRKNSLTNEIQENEFVQQNKSRFSIQLVALSKEKDPDDFKGVPNLFYKKDSGLFKYYSGRYSNRDEAIQAKSKLSELGYSDAFIVSLDPTKETFVQN